MLKKLWQRFVKKAEAEEDEKQEDGREDGQSNRQDKQEKETNYVSVTSVPAAIRDIYFGLFSLQAVVIGIYKVIEAVAADPQGLDKGQWWDTGLAVWHLAWAESGPVLLASTLFTIAAMEIGVYAVVLAQKIAKESRLKVKRIEDKLRAEGRVEGHAEAASESEQWLARMQEAQRKGEPFDEEPPWRGNGASES